MTRRGNAETMRRQLKTRDWLETRHGMQMLLAMVKFTLWTQFVTLNRTVFRLQIFLDPKFVRNKKPTQKNVGRKE